MRALFLLLTISACGPGFGVGDPDSGGVVVIGDAGTDVGTGIDVGPTMGPDGGIVLTQPVLAQTDTCAEIFESRYEFLDYDEEPSGVQFFNPAEVVGGSLRFPPDDTTGIGVGSNVMYSLSNYRSLGTCTDVRLPAPGEGRRLATAGKAFGDGVSCGIDGDGAEGVLEMIEVSADGSAVLGRVAAPWLADEREVRIFTFNEGTKSICEVMRLDTEEVLRLESDEATSVDAIHYELIVRGDGEAGQAFVRESSTGVPQGPFRMLSR